MAIPLPDFNILVVQISHQICF